MTAKNTILFKAFFDYFRPTFPDDETTRATVRNVLALSEETKPTLQAMNEYAKVAAWEAWKYGRQLSAEMTTSPAFEAWYEQFKSK